MIFMLAFVVTTLLLLATGLCLLLSQWIPLYAAVLILGMVMLSAAILFLAIRLNNGSEGRGDSEAEHEASAASVFSRQLTGVLTEELAHRLPAKGKLDDQLVSALYQHPQLATVLALLGGVAAGYNPATRRMLIAALEQAGKSLTDALEQDSM